MLRRFCRKCAQERTHEKGEGGACVGPRMGCPSSTGQRANAGGAQGCSLAGGEHAEVPVGDTWPGRGGDRLCDGSTRSSVSQGKKGQGDC